MKTHPLLSAVFLAAALLCPALRAQEAPAAPVPEQGAAVVGDIPAPLPDGRAYAPPAAPRLPDFQIKNSVRKFILAEEPSGVPGLPPIKKWVAATTHLVADPQLPQPPPPAPPADPNDPALKARLAAMRAAYQPTRMLGFSATTYDAACTRLRWRAKDRPGEQITAWSNLNFEYIRGHSDLVIAGKKYMLFLGYGMETTANLKRSAARRGVPYVPPVLPELPELAAAGPAFVITEGDATGTPELEFLTGLHAVWPAEAPRLKATYEARLKAQREREDYFRAHPPVPQDVEVYFWDKSPQTNPPALKQPAQGVRP